MTALLLSDNENRFQKKRGTFDGAMNPKSFAQADKRSDRKISKQQSSSIIQQYRRNSNNSIQIVEENQQQSPQKKFIPQNQRTQTAGTVQTINSKIVTKSLLKKFSMSQASGSQISANSIKRRYPNFNQVTVLQKGKSFGQLALIKNKPRAAGILCKTHCSFAVMDRYDYKKVLGKIEQKTLNRMTDFLFSLPFFATWTRGSIQKFQYFFSNKQYTRNQVVFHQNQKTDNVYLVVNGDFQISIRHTFIANKSLDCMNLLTGQKGVAGNFNKSVLINSNFFQKTPAGGQNPFSDKIKKSKCVRVIKHLNFIICIVNDFEPWKPNRLR